MPDTPTDPTLAAIMAGIRTLASAAGPFIVAKGWVSADSWVGIVALAGSVATFAYGVYRTHSRVSVIAGK